jgi:polyhydroxyalkanoate synthase
VPWKAAYGSKDLIGIGARFVLAASGHVAGVINPPARNKRSHWLNDQLVSDPNSWLEKAEERSGSWWSDWDAWMKRHSSGIRPAPAQPGNARYQTIEPAPGHYVKQKSN